MGEHVEILLGGVEHRQGVRLEQAPERRHVDGERVDQRDLAVTPAELHQCEGRKVGAFPMEFGVDRVPLLGEHRVDDLTQAGVVVDPPVVELGRHAPASTGRPESTQASVPPATFTTSRPWAATNSHARILRAPDRQIT